MQTLPQSPPNVNKRDKAKELRQQIDDRLDTLAKAVDDVRASETFRQFLAVQARFHKYSWHNSLLICMQRPQASRVAGYKTWQSLGRQVRKGEHGITIFAPCPWKREVERDNGDTETEQGIYFRAVHVFDVAQTDGPDLPDVDVPTIDTVADDLLADLRELSSRMMLYGWGGNARKCYIIDEIQHLNRDCQRMLLGILENLPSHVIFIGTTTSVTWADEVDGLFSRWRRFRFRKPSAPAIAEHVERIAREQGLPIPDGFRFLAYVQGKYVDVGGNNIRASIDQLPDALRRYKGRAEAAAA